MAKIFLLYFLSAAVGVDPRFAIAAQELLSVEPFKPLRRLERAAANAPIIPGDIAHKNAYYVGKWCVVEPWWLVGMIQSGPYWPGSPTPERWPEPTARSMIVADIRDGSAQRLKVREPTEHVSQVFSFKAAHLAFTIASEPETRPSSPAPPSVDRLIPVGGRTWQVRRFRCPAFEWGPGRDAHR